MALASAALFTLAIVYVLRSKAVRVETLGHESGEPRRQREIFSDVLVGSPFSARGLALSTALHVTVLLGTPLVPYLFPERLNFDFRKYNVKIVEFRIPTPLLYAGPGASTSQPAAKSASRRRTARARLRHGGALQARVSRPAARSVTPRRPAAKGPQVAQAAKPQHPLPARERPRFQLQLPWAAHAKSKDVIIQPDQPLDLAIAVPQPLPSAFLWAQGPAPLDPSQVVGAPPKPEPVQFSLPHSTPVVQPPNKEAAISDLQIASGPELTFRPPQLSVSPANVAPVRMPPPPIESPGELPASTLPGGNPVNLIALMNTPAPPAASYVTEVGQRLPDSQPPASDADTSGASTPASGENPAAAMSQAPQPGVSPAASPELLSSKATNPAGASLATSGSPDGALAGGTAAADATAGSGAAEGATAATATGPTTAASNTPAAGLAATSAGAATGASETPAKGTFADLLNAGAGAPEHAAAEAARAETAPRRVWPSGGNLGVVIVQQSSEESVLEGGEALTGQPVYTVYFDVPGAPRRWILQYCVPGSVTPKSFVTSDDGVIHIVPRRSVQPPFPLDRIPLNLKAYQGEAQRLVVYAVVDERGETVNVRVIRGTGADIDTAAVDTLKRWAFRPAMRGDTPVAVEALFGIPLR
ncbi:MAG TPA: energy transducer TonB [Bryobacterales bacterium]|nr:energy transducer TonB [Bryobacterales bacterium]